MRPLDLGSLENLALVSGYGSPAGHGPGHVLVLSNIFGRCVGNSKDRTTQEFLGIPRVTHRLRKVEKKFKTKQRARSKVVAAAPFSKCRMNSNSKGIPKM